jgi:hypothetical protein
MKRIFLFALVGLMACHSSNTQDSATGETSSTGTGTSTNADEEKGTITFKANGETVNTSVLNLAGFQFANQPKGLNITSDMHQEKRGVNMNIGGYAAGDYPFTIESGKAMHALGLYYPDYGQANDFYQFINGHVNVTRFDTVKNVMEATFSGTAKNAEGKTVQITDGVLNGRISPMQAMPE